MTNVPHHIETSQLICIANQLTGFYMMGEHLSLMGYKKVTFYRFSDDPEKTKHKFCDAGNEANLWLRRNFLVLLQNEMSTGFQENDQPFKYFWIVLS